MNGHKAGVFWWLAVILDAGGAAALLFGLGAHWLVAWLVPVNAVTFLLYAYDKPAARAARPRVPEKLLHVHALIGGSPAAIVAQRLLRHKSIKGSFQLVMWLIVVVQIGAVGVYLWLSTR